MPSVMILYAAATALSRGLRMSPEPNFLNSYLLSWNSPIYDPVRCLGSKPDSTLATAFMKVKSRPKASDARLISSTGVPTGMSLNERKTIAAGFSAGGSSDQTKQMRYRKSCGPELEEPPDAPHVVGGGWATSRWPKSADSCTG